MWDLYSSGLSLVKSLWLSYIPISSENNVSSAKCVPIDILFLEELVIYYIWRDFTKYNAD